MHKTMQTSVDLVYSAVDIRCFSLLSEYMLFVFEVLERGFRGKEGWPTVETGRRGDQALSGIVRTRRYEEDFRVYDD